MPEGKSAPPPQPFSQLLQLQRKGLLHAELSDQLQAVIAAVSEHGKVGALTVKFSVKPTGDGMVAITDTYSAKVPTPPAEPSVFFIDDTGQFSRDRLNQEKLAFTEVGAGASAKASA